MGVMTYQRALVLDQSNQSGHLTETRQKTSFQWCQKRVFKKKIVTIGLIVKVLNQNKIVHVDSQLPRNYQYKEANLKNHNNGNKREFCKGKSSNSWKIIPLSETV